MGIHLFNIITFLVDAQFIAVSEFSDACKILKFWLFFQPLLGRALKLIISRKSLSTEVFLQIWKDGNHLMPGPENMVDDTFIQIRI